MLRGTEAPICCSDNLSREVFCLPGACIRDIKKRISVMIKPDDYYHFPVFQIGLQKDEKKIKKRKSKKTVHPLGRY